MIVIHPTHMALQRYGDTIIILCIFFYAFVHYLKKVVLPGTALAFFRAYYYGIIITLCQTQYRMCNINSLEKLEDIGVSLLSPN